jgi:hypothetical protein
MGGRSNTGGGDSQFKPPSYVVPYSKQMLETAGGLSQNPYTPYGGQRINPFTDFQNQGFNMVGAQSGWGQDLTGQGVGQLGSTLAGDYLQGNPYLDQIIGQAQGDIANQYKYMTAPGNMAMASRSGSLDNSGVAGKDMMDQFGAMRAMGDVENQLRYGNYAQERQNQLGAVGQALGYGQQALGNLQEAGSQQQQLGQAGLDVQFDEFLRMLQDPYDKLGVLQQAVQTGQGGYGSTKERQSVPNWAIGSTIGGSLLGK